jgi:hypothetical protein
MFSLGVYNCFHVLDMILVADIMDMTVSCKLKAPNKIIIFILKDTLMGTMQCYAMHCLLMSNLLLIKKPLLMAPVDRLNAAVIEATD